MLEQSLTFDQKIKLNLVFTAVNLLWVFDDFFGSLRKSALSFGRLGLFIVLMSTFFQAFRLESHPLDINVFGFTYEPSNVRTQVLGASTTNIELPYVISGTPFPEVTSRAIYAVDLVNNKILFAKDSDLKLAPASTAKLMTALVSLEIYKTNDVVVIPDLCTKIEGQKNGFKTGEKYTVEELLSSLLINSSADAACALSIGKISYAKFVDMMNQKVNTYSLNSTHFTNPVGLDDASGSQFTTAEDLYTLSMAARKYPLIKKLVATKDLTITSISEPAKKMPSVAYTISNTNKLLWDIPGTVGIKTGKTEAAGEVLIYEYNKDGKNLIIVVMGSQDRFTDTKKILDWLLSSFSWQK